MVDSPSTSHVLPILVKSISSQLSLDESSVLQLLPQSSLICRSPCFSSMETLIKLELQVKKVKEEIASRILQSGLYASTSNQDYPEAPSTKRRCIGSGNTPSRTRQLLFTVDTHNTSPKAMVRSWLAIFICYCTNTLTIHLHFLYDIIRWLLKPKSPDIFISHLPEISWQNILAEEIGSRL